MKNFMCLVGVLVPILLISEAIAADRVVIVPLNSCSSGFTKCEGKCVDTANNPLFCGTCTTACSEGFFCSSGVCASRCDDNNDCTNDTYDPLTGCSYTAIPDCQVCNPVAGTGCSAGNKCTFIFGVGITTCTANGDKATGESCTTPESGADDCVAGAYCISSVCQEICSTSPDSCPEGYYCQVNAGVFSDQTGVGVCTPNCDPVTQDCSDTSLGCYLQTITGDSSCAEVPTGAQGVVQDDLCYGPEPGSCYLNGCDKGYGANQPDSTCAFFCSTIDNWLGNIQGLAGNPAGITCGATFGGVRPDGPGAGYECRYIQSFYSNTELVPETIGMCMSNSTYGTCGNFDWVQLQADISSGASSDPDYCTNFPNRCMTECISLATFNAATAQPDTLNTTSAQTANSLNIELYKSFSSMRKRK